MKTKETYFNVKRNKDYNNEERILEYQRTGNLEIRNEIVEQNLPLLIKKASKYYHPIQIELDDLIDTAVIILINAIDNYQPGEVKFSTYASRAIQNSLSNCVSEWLGEGIHRYGNPIKKYRMTAVSIFGNKADIYNEDVVDYVLAIMVEKEYIEKDDVQEVRCRLLSKKLSDLDEDELEIVENITLDQEDDTHEVYFIEKHKKSLLSLLTDAERTVIEYECGFIDGKPHTQVEVARILGVSRQSVNSHEKKAKEKMKRKAELYL